MSFEDDERRFVARMIEKRNGKGWSQREMARQLQMVGLNWKQQTLARVEVDENPRPLRLSEASAIATFFGETIESMCAPEEMTAWNITVRSAAEALLGQELRNRRWETQALEGEFYDAINSRLADGESVPEEYERPVQSLPRSVRDYLKWLGNAPEGNAAMSLQDEPGGIYEAAVEESHRIRVESVHAVTKQDHPDGSA